MKRLATKSQRQTVYLLQEGLCAICGEELTDRFEVDHMQEFANDGVTELWNLQALCKSCHSEKTRAMVRSAFCRKLSKVESH